MVSMLEKPVMSNTLRTASHTFVTVIVPPAVPMRFCAPSRTRSPAEDT